MTKFIRAVRREMNSWARAKTLSPWSMSFWVRKTDFIRVYSRPFAVNICVHLRLDLFFYEFC
jgi:hypothetical protein